MFKVKPLSYEYYALEPFIDEATMKVHHDGHYTTYINNLNDLLNNFPNLANQPLEQLLADPQAIPEEIRQKLINNGGGVYNHELYWETLSPQQTAPQDKLLELINQYFGSFDGFKENFTTSATTLFGSGWTWLVENQGVLEIVNSANQNTPLSEGKQPLLGIDLWEHAYYLKYQNKRKDYIIAWWNIVNFRAVEKRLRV